MLWLLREREKSGSRTHERGRRDEIGVVQLSDIRTNYYVDSIEMGIAKVGLLTIDTCRKMIERVEQQVSLKSFLNLGSMDFLIVKEENQVLLVVARSLGQHTSGFLFLWFSVFYTSFGQSKSIVIYNYRNKAFTMH